MKCKKFKGRRFSSVRDFHKKEGSSNGDRKKKGRKRTWCASSARNQCTFNMIVLSTRVKPRREKRQWWSLRVIVKKTSLKKKKMK